MLPRISFFDPWVLTKLRYVDAEVPILGRDIVKNCEQYLENQKTEESKLKGADSIDFIFLSFCRLPIFSSQLVGCISEALSVTGHNPIDL